MERLSASNPSVQFLSLIARLEEILRSLDQHFEACDTELQDLRRQVSQSRARARALSEEGAQKNQQSQNETEKRIETDKENRVLRAALDDAIACLSAYLEVQSGPKHQMTRAPEGQDEDKSEDKGEDKSEGKDALPPSPSSARVGRADKANKADKTTKTAREAEAEALVISGTSSSSSSGVLPAGLSRLEARAGPGTGVGPGVGAFFGSPSREKGEWNE